MTQAEFNKWVRFEVEEEQRVKKIDVYFAQVIALLHCMCNPKRSYNPKDYIIGDVPSDQDLRTMTEQEVLAMWKTAVPYATWTPTEA